MSTINMGKKSLCLNTFAYLVLLLIPLLTPLFVSGSASAQGATDPVWIDAAHIEYDGVIYTDPKWDKVDLFVPPGSSYSGNENEVDAIKKFYEECTSFIQVPDRRIDVDITDGIVLGGGVGFDPIGGNESQVGVVELAKTVGEPCEEVGGGIFQSGSVANANIWFYKIGDQMVSVFQNGGAGESPFLGPYDLYDPALPNSYADKTILESIITKTPGSNTAIWNLNYTEGQRSTDKSILIGAEEDAPITIGNDIANLQPSCESRAGAFSFGLCPLLHGANKAVETLDGVIRKALEVKPEYYENQDIKIVWGRFRNIGYILLIPIMLVMVIATALGFKGIDAYTVKRAMPRLLAAVIFMALSYDLAVIMIEITNAVGQSVGGLIAGPFGGTEALKFDALFNPSGFTDAAALGTGVLAGISLLLAGPAIIGILASYLGVAALALIIIFSLLTIRELIIVFLIILAPVAILSWIFPGKDAMWKLWWNTFTKLLMLYPLIIGALVTGRVFAVITNEIEVTGIEAIFMVLVKLTAYIGPFFFIPAMFKFAGGALGNLAGMVNDRSKGVFDRQKKYRADKRKKIGDDIKGGRAWKGGKEGGFRDRLNKRGQDLTNIRAGATSNLRGEGGLLRKGGLKAARERIEGIRTFEDADKAKEIMESQGEAGVLMNDNLARAVASTDTEKELRDRLLSDTNYQKSVGIDLEYNTDGSLNMESAQTQAGLRQMNMDIANIQNLRREHGGSSRALKSAAFIQSLKGGTAYSAEEAWEEAGKIAGDDDAYLSKLVADGRSASMSAGRLDVGGGNFGDTLRYAQRLTGELDAAEKKTATDGFLDHVYESNGAQAVTHSSMKKQSIEAMIPTMNKRLDEEFESGDQKRIERASAEAASVYETLRATSPRYAARFGDEVMNKERSIRKISVNEEGLPVQDIEETAMPTWKVVEEMRGKAQYGNFHEVRQEWQQQQVPPGVAAAQAAERARQAGSQDPGGSSQPPTVTPY